MSTAVDNIGSEGHYFHPRITLNSIDMHSMTVFKIMVEDQSITLFLDLSQV